MTSPVERLGGAMVRFSHWKKTVEQRGRRASRFAHLETAARAGDGGAVQAGLRDVMGVL
jgi:hypothetical protein